MVKRSALPLLIAVALILPHSSAAFAQTATRSPASDEAVSGSWSGSAGSRYTLVSDYPDTIPNTTLQSPTAAGGAQITFGLTAFSLPSNAISISVQVKYHDVDASSGTNNAGGRLKVGGNYYNSGTHNPSGTTLTARSDNWPTNPKTSAAWTVDEINGLGANSLQAFGINSTDASPAFKISDIQLQVTYSLNTCTGDCVQSVACGAASGGYSCTTASTAGGHLLTVIEADFAASAGVPSPPTVTGGAASFVQDCSLTAAGNGRVTVFHAENVTAGTTQVNLAPASGASSSVVTEWQNAKPSGAFDACSTALSAYGSSPLWASAPITASQADLAIGFVFTRSGSSFSYVPLSDWTALTDAPNSGDGDELYTTYIEGSAWGPYAASGASSGPSGQWAGLALFKRADPGGDNGYLKLPTLVTFEGAHGAPLSLDAVQATTHGMMCVWSATQGAYTGMTFSTSGQLATFNTGVNTNGAAFTGSGSTGFAYDLSVSGAAANKLRCTLPNGLSPAAASASFFFNFPNTGDAEIYNIFSIAGGDWASLFIRSGAVGLETATGDAVGTIPIAYGHTYWATIHYESSSGTHKLRLYDPGSAWAQVGNELTHSSTGTGVSSFDLGRTGAEAGSPAMTYYADNLVLDLTGAFPLLPWAPPAGGSRKQVRIIQ